MTEAPKVIWANVVAESYGKGLCGEWNHCDVGSPDDTRYIRADAPELVALVEAASKLADAAEYGAVTSTHVVDYDSALAKWEELTK